MCYIDEAFTGIDRFYWESLSLEEQEESCKWWAEMDAVVDDLYKRYEISNG